MSADKLNTDTIKIDAYTKRSLKLNTDTVQMCKTTEQALKSDTANRIFQILLYIYDAGRVDLINFLKVINTGVLSIDNNRFLERLLSGDYRRELNSILYEIKLFGQYGDKKFIKMYRRILRHQDILNQLIKIEGVDTIKNLSHLLTDDTGRVIFGICTPEDGEPIEFGFEWGEYVSGAGDSERNNWLSLKRKDEKKRQLKRIEEKKIRSIKSIWTKKIFRGEDIMRI